MEKKYISSAVVRRLPRYYRYLGELIESGVDRISSGELSQKMKVTASQIRQDLNNFGGFGQQGYGYNVISLYKEIGNILGLDRTYKMIIIGAGNLGKAIANYSNFDKRGFKVTAIFDKNKDMEGVVLRNVSVKNISELEDFVANNEVDIAALAIPKQQATELAEILINHGVKAFWNFAHTDLNVPDDVLVENVHLSESLMRLSYKITNENHKGE